MVDQNPARTLTPMTDEKLNVQPKVYIKLGASLLIVNVGKL